MTLETDNIRYSDEAVLVVDDEEFVREPIVAMMERLGFKADAERSGKAGAVIPALQNLPGAVC
jgi:CheY-like chemotaxis protein